MSVKVQVVFYSMYGHIYRMATEVAAGVVDAGAEAELLQVPELVPEVILESSGASTARAVFAHVPIATVEHLGEADAVIFGVPTRYGMMCAQMRNFLDQTGPLWMVGKLIGKVGSVFTSSATQHGGQESTILSFHTTMLHHGMLIAGIPYSEKGQSILTEISGGSPYGASTISGPGGKRTPSENELALARYQGKRTAEIAIKLKG